MLALLDAAGHATCFAQQDLSKHDESRGLKSAWTSELALSGCSVLPSEATGEQSPLSYR